MVPLTHTWCTCVGHCCGTLECPCNPPTPPKGETVTWRLSPPPPPPRRGGDFKGGGRVHVSQAREEANALSSYATMLQVKEGSGITYAHFEGLECAVQSYDSPSPNDRHVYGQRVNDMGVQGVAVGHFFR